MKIGDRIKVNRNEPNPRLHGMTGTIVNNNTGYWQVKMDDNVLGWADSTGSFDSQSISVITSKGDILEMAQRNRDAMLDEIDKFREAAEAGTLGDFSELGFLYHLLQALTKE